MAEHRGVLVVPRGQIDLERGVFRDDSGDVEALGTRELALLRYLAERPGVDVARAELLAEVWGYSDQVLSRAVDYAVRRLRARIEQVPADPRCLLTSHGTGYRLVPADATPPRSIPGSASGIRILLTDGHIDLARLVVDREGGEHGLTPLEAGLLTELHRAHGGFVGVPELIRRVWSGGGSRRSLVSLVHRLRGKLEGDPSSPEVLIGGRGRGYRLAAAKADPPGAEVWRPPPNAFVGRRDLLEDVQRSVGEHALITLRGPAGVGKTRLVQELLERWSGARVWIQLAGVARGDLWPTLAAGVAAPTATPTAVATSLRDREDVLVVLDNAEHLAEPVALCLEEIRQAGARSPTVVATQVALGLSWEHVIEVPPLALDDAIRLYRTRSSRSDPVEVSARLVQALDCLPLAIELAAGTTLGPSEVLERLATRGDLLQNRDPTAPRRHRSLRAAIEGSWQLLGPNERRSVSLLSVFAGPFGLEAAEAVLQEASGDLAPLVERSLVRSTAVGGGSRFELLDSVRRYALDVADPDALARARARHADHYARVAVDAHQKGRGTDLAQEDPELLAELPNLLAAFEYGGSKARSSLALLLSGWLRRTGQVARAVQTVSEALEHADDDPTRAALLNERALARLTVDAPAADADATRALDLASGCADREGEMMACTTLGLLASRRAETDEGERWLTRALEISATFDPRELRFRDLRVAALNHLGLHRSRQRRLAEADELLLEALSLARRAQARGVILLNLGLNRLRRRDHVGAGRDGEAAEAHLAGTPYRAQHSQAVVLQGNSAWALGQHDVAEAHLIRAVQLAEASGSRTNYAFATGDLAGLYVETGRFDEALEVAAAGLDASSLDVRPPRVFLNLYRCAALALLGRRTEAQAALAAARRDLAVTNDERGIAAWRLYRRLLHPEDPEPQSLPVDFDVDVAARIVRQQVG